MEYIPVVYYVWDCTATTTSTESHIIAYDIIHLCKPYVIRGHLLKASYDSHRTGIDISIKGVSSFTCLLRGVITWSSLSTVNTCSKNEMFFHTMYPNPFWPTVDRLLIWWRSHLLSLSMHSTHWSSFSLGQCWKHSSSPLISFIHLNLNECHTGE